MCVFFVFFGMFQGIDCQVGSIFLIIFSNDVGVLRCTRGAASTSSARLPWNASYRRWAFQHRSHDCVVVANRLHFQQKGKDFKQRNEPGFHRLQFLICLDVSTL